MKTKEFIEKVNKLGFGIEYYKNPLSNVGLRCDYDLFTIYLEDKDLVEIWTNCRYAISTISDGHSCYITGYDVKELYKLCFEYASTPVEDREEEKKYYLRHRWLTEGGFYRFVKHHTKAYGKKYELASWTFGDTSDMQYTLKEIEEIKKKFDTDLKDFELVEVEE